jgi:hypothetical protein
MKKQLSIAEFYQKYFRVMTEDDKRYPAFRDADMEFFNMVDKAAKEGKYLLMNKPRPFNRDAYMYSLTKTAMQLTAGDKICLLSQKPKQLIDDLKRYFNIDVSVEPSKVDGKVQEDISILTLIK